LFVFRGSPWHKLRHEDFSEIDVDNESGSLFEVIKGMMRKEVAKRMTIEQVYWQQEVRDARERMGAMREKLVSLGCDGASLFGASALARDRVQ
jgi:mitosis inhibitor protein kinase SWE1